MLLSEFSFDLPEELIAQTPAVPRDSARLLVYERATGRLEHRFVRDLPELLPAPTLLVANNSKVRKARLHAQVEQRTIEIVALEPVDDGLQRCMIGGKGMQTGMTAKILNKEGTASGITAHIVLREAHAAMNTYLLRFSEDIETILERFGSLPLPPYIKGKDSEEGQYQTVFASQTGSAAAPTAGLHFTPHLIQTLKERGHSWQEVTLHVGMGTFLPLRHEEITKNELHSEWTIISPSTAAILNEQAGAVLAIGTTATRTLESHTVGGRVKAGERRTNTFIYPGYRFRTVNRLLTNFHLPKSSLLLLVAAFLGNNPEGSVVRSEKEMVQILHHIYEEAIQRQYRFFSFGDAMLIL